MTYIDTGVQALDNAREALRQILASAVAADAFEDIAAIARAGQSLAAITAELRASAEARQEQAHEEQRSTALSADKAKGVVGTDLASGGRNERFPQYFRAGDRLVKRGWSKKERQPYEHKAPREIVDALFKAIRNRRGDRRPFGALDIMPLYKKTGEEYPSYQSYLALGWLRQAGGIAKGRDGYVLKAGFDEQRVAQVWDTLQSVG